MIRHERRSQQILCPPRKELLEERHDARHKEGAIAEIARFTVRQPSHTRPTHQRCQSLIDPRQHNCHRTRALLRSNEGARQPNVRALITQGFVASCGCLMIACYQEPILQN